MNLFSPPQTIRIKRGYIRHPQLFAHTVTADAGQPGTAVAPFETPDRLERREYAWRSASLESEFAVPFLAALGCGMLTTLLTGSVTYILAPTYTSPTILLTFSGISTLALWRFINRQLDSLWTIEEYTTAALPPPKASPALPPKEVHIEITETRAGQGAAMKFLDLPITEPQLQRMATHLVANHHPFSRRELRAILSQSEYAEVRDKLSAAGLLRETDRKGTVELTAAGRKMFTKLL